MKNKIKTTLSFVAVIISVFLLVTGTILAENEIINSSVASAFVVISTILVCISVFCAAKTDYETGVYECRKCGHIFKPTFKAYICGAHTLTLRFLKCPECGRKSWCIRKKLN